MVQKLAFSIPGVLPSDSPVEVPVPSGLPTEATSGLSLTGKNFLSLGLNLIFALAIFIAVVTLIFSGIQWITSGGDPEKISGAKKRFTYSVIGIIVVATAFLVVSFIYTALTGQSNTFLKLGN